MIKSKEYVLIESTEKGLLFPVGSVLDINGVPVFWRDFDNSRFLFKKGNYTAIYQDDEVIKYLETTPVKDMYFRDYRTKKIYKTALETYKNAKIVNMKNRRQRGVNLMRFEELEGMSLPENTRPDTKVVINN